MKPWLKIKNFIASIRGEKTIRLEKIILINNEKITAVTPDGNTVIINTNPCRINFYMSLMGSEYVLTDTDMMIGERNFMAEPKYILFYSDPMYYIELDPDSYENLRRRLESFGLQTFDVT